MSRRDKRYNMNTNLFSFVKLINTKTVFFGIAGFLGGGLGSLVSEVFVLYENNATYSLFINIAIRAALVGLCISIGLLVAQSIYLKKRIKIKSLLKTATIGIGMGAVAGVIAQFIFGYTYDISVVVEAISRAVCWGILGFGIGWGVSLFVPNYPKKRAIAAGYLGGFLGGAIFRATFLIPAISVKTGRFIGFAILGLFIGLAISIIEEALRQAWLTVIYGSNETRTISLGEKPISFGSSPEDDIYVDKELRIKTTVQIENSQVVVIDKQTNNRQVLQNGSQVNLGKISFMINTKG